MTPIFMLLQRFIYTHISFNICIYVEWDLVFIILFYYALFYRPQHILHATHSLSLIAMIAIFVIFALYIINNFIYDFDQTEFQSKTKQMYLSKYIHTYQLIVD